MRDDQDAISALSCIVPGRWLNRIAVQDDSARVSTRDAGVGNERAGRLTARPALGVRFGCTRAGRTQRIGSRAGMSPFVIVHRLAARNSSDFSARAIDIPGRCVHYEEPDIGQMTLYVRVQLQNSL